MGIKGRCGLCGADGLTVSFVKRRSEENVEIWLCDACAALSDEDFFDKKDALEDKMTFSEEDDDGD